MAKKDLKPLVQYLASSGGGAISAALITEGGTIVVPLTAATIAATLYAKGKINERKQKLKTQELKDQPSATASLKNIFKGLPVDHDFIIAVYWNEGEESVSVVGHKNTEIARKLEKEKLLLRMDEIFRLADYRDVRFLSF